VFKKSVWEVATQVGSCRLCNGVFQKSELQNNVSVRMLLEFLHHLRRRTRLDQLDKLDFVNLLSLNRKENAMSAVCECCYALIIKELQLKKY
jgi:predicted membrane chloride channel (bestrophin family)